MGPIANWTDALLLQFFCLGNVPVSTKESIHPAFISAILFLCIFSAHIQPRDMTVYVHQETFMSKSGPNAKKFTNRKIDDSNVVYIHIEILDGKKKEQTDTFNNINDFQ